MPAITLPDGTNLTWGDSPAYSEPSANVLSTVPEPFASANGSNDSVVLYHDGKEATSGKEPEGPNPSSTVTPEDVSTALAKVPPKWTATAWRFVKTLGAALAAAFVVTGGTIEGVAKDPTAFLTALGAAVVMAVQKFASWRD